MPLLFLSFLSSAFAQVFPNFQAASMVIGQPDFNTITPIVDQTHVPHASASAISAKGHFAVACSNEGRIMIWNTIPTNSLQPADVVVGKPDFVSAVPGVSQTLMRSSMGVAFSPDGEKLIASDSGNHRVLIWNSIPTVNGQAELAADISFNLATQGVGGLVQMLVKITNNGDTTASNVVVFTVPPIGLVTNGAPIVSTGTYNIASGFWNIPSLGVGQVATITFNLKVDATAQTAQLQFH